MPLYRPLRLSVIRPAFSRGELSLPRAHARHRRRGPPGRRRGFSASSRREPQEVRVIVGVKDGTPSARVLREKPDPAGEPARRIRRIEAQKRLVGEVSAAEFRPRHYYESFSLVSGTASRDGVVRLANRPDVTWVTLDQTRRRFQVSPQASQTLIRSDAANASGFTGAGQAVAVLDTGVDYTAPQLGGGTFPNSKVIGGMDVADEDSDPMDCDGHGTSVSGVIAGPNGVAPDAKIVAIKVFPSNDAVNSTCKDTAFVSDIIQGINFAISHRAEFHIGTINMSLGAEPDDATDQGYCDNSEPDEADAIDSAVAADGASRRPSATSPRRCGTTSARRASTRGSRSWSTRWRSSWR